jgi:glycosyltransferase involved in cell wall biosynthesis
MTNTQKKVLYIVEADLSSGSGKCAIELIRLLKGKTEFIPIVITQYHNNLNIECDKLSVENYSVHYARTCSFGMGKIGWLIAFFCRPFLNFYSYKKLKKFIDFNSLYLIHSNSSSIDFGAYLYKKLKIPHIWHVREFLVFEHLHMPIINNLPKYIVQNSSLIITASNKLSKFIRIRTKCNNIKMIYDGVHFNSYKTKSHPINDFCKLRLVCVGNLTPIKGQDVLLKAIGLLPEQVQNSVLIDFYGLNTDDFEKKLKVIAKKNDIEQNISFKGFCSNIFDILPNYDIGIQPSHTEGFSRVTVEYMLAGLCVIGNGDTAIQELIEDGKTGFLYKDFNIQSLADKISYCYNNRKEMKTLGQNAQKIALEKYCIEKNFNKIVNEYRLIGNRSFNE